MAFVCFFFQKYIFKRIIYSCIYIHIYIIYFYIFAYHWFFFFLSKFTCKRKTARCLIASNLHNYMRFVRFRYEKKKGQTRIRIRKKCPIGTNLCDTLSSRSNKSNLGNISLIMSIIFLTSNSNRSWINTLGVQTGF